MTTRAPAGVSLFNRDGSVTLTANGEISATGGGGGGPASGDVTGTLPGPYTVVGLQGVDIDPTAPSAGDALIFDGTAWVATPLPGGGTVTAVTASAPLTTSGSPTAPNVEFVDGVNDGDVLSWDGVGDWTTALNVLRAQGVTAPSGTLALSATAGNASLSSSSTTIVQAVSIVALERIGGTQFWLTASGLQTYSATGLAREETINATGANLVDWTATITGLTDQIADRATAGTGAGRSLRAQTATAGAGGILDLRSGGGSTTPGSVLLRVGGQTALSIDGPGVTGRVTIGPAAFGGTHNINSSTSTSASAGAAEALPSPPAGYLDIEINGAPQRIAYYNP